MTRSSDPVGPAPAITTGRGLVLEPYLAFLFATGVAAVLFGIGRQVPFVWNNLHGFIAIVFLYVPWLAARIFRTPFDYRDAGLRLAPVRRGLGTLAIALAVTWPLFVLGFFLFYENVCGSSLALADWWWQVFAPICPRWLGIADTPLILPSGFAALALSQLVVVALPEELFFRGYLYQRFEHRWPSQRRLWGAQVGWPLLVTSALFALGHVLVDLDPRRFAVFFPGLAFGWMRARTGAVAAGAVYHAGCNLLSEILHHSYFG